MTTIRTQEAPARRKPRAIEFSVLFGWHALLSGAFIVAYLSSDEDTYAMPQFAGYTVLAALALRLIAALLAPQGSPLRLPRPALGPVREWISAAWRARSQPLPRRPLLALAAVVLLVFVGAAAGSGAVADFVPSVEGIHEAIGELAPWIVLAHVALVAALYRRSKARTARDIAPRARPSPPREPKPGTGIAVILAAGLICLSGVALAGDPARDAVLDTYARQAKAEAPGFDGFSAARGEQLYQGPHSGGNPQTPACASCHTADPRTTGRHVKTGRPIEPMAISVEPGRLTDAANVEKRFGRDCPNVLGRPCTAQEKGDFITFLSGR
jgi:cytochrome b